MRSRSMTALSGPIVQVHAHSPSSDSDAMTTRWRWASTRRLEHVSAPGWKPPSGWMMFGMPRYSPAEPPPGRYEIQSAPDGSIIEAKPAPRLW